MALALALAPSPSPVPTQGEEVWCRSRIEEVQRASEAAKDAHTAGLPPYPSPTQQVFPHTGLQLCLGYGLGYTWT